MKVRCIANKFKKLDKDKIYTPIDEDEEYYLINITGDIIHWFGKENFEIVKESVMKFKVGDKVKIREDLVIEKEYQGFNFNGGMDKYKGITTTIKTANEKYYTLDIYRCNWSWTDEMLELVEKAKENETMKISRWIELHNIKNEKYELKYHGMFKEAYISILNILKNSTASTIGTDEPTETILSQFKLFGFDIEFIEKPTLTRKEFEFLSCIEFPVDKIVYKAVNSYARISFNGENVNMVLKPDMFKFIKTNESWKVEDLLKLKVEE